ncbi:MAG: diaminopimelate epimerase [Gammaproteobacteria bacterium]
MHTLPFTKMQGLGNDFVVLNNLAQDINLTTVQIRLIADRHFGIGCDQILILDPAPNANVDFGYRIFNADGSISGQCGNGARCLGKFIQQHQLSTKTSLKIETSNTVMELQLLPEDIVSVNMGAPKFSPQSLPMLLPQQEQYELKINSHLIHFNALSMGNPHVVIPVEDVALIAIDEIGAAFNTHRLFPEGVNVGFMQILNRTQIKLRVFERGCGETLACGSGACAAMVAARLHHWVDATAEVFLPGGSLSIEWQGENQPVLMSGAATTVFDGVYLFKKS